MINYLNALMDPMQLQQNISNAFVAGRNMRKEIELERAVSAYGNNPDDPTAARRVMQIDPKLGIQLREAQAEEAERARAGQFRTELSTYLGDGSGALGGMMPGAAAPGGGAGPVAPGGVPAAAGPGAVADPAAPAAQTETHPMALQYGEPRTGRDKAFLKMLQIDPVKALKIKSDLRDTFVDQLETQRNVFDWSVSRFAGVSDEPSYQQARGELAQHLSALGPDGQNILAELPANYPGPEAMNALRMRALDAKEQISAFQTQHNIDVDNARADRNTDSLIDTREQRLNIYRDNTRADNARADRNTSSLIDRRNNPLPRSGKSAGGSQIVDVQTPDQARKLAKGTRFRTPDGQIKVR